MKYCTYITYHAETGKYYVGKARIDRVENGSYVGSGKRLHQTFKKYPRDEWYCTVIAKFATSDEAYAHEAKLVDEQLLSDPNCLNLIPGGRAPKLIFEESFRQKKEALKEMHRKMALERKALKNARIRAANKGKVLSEEHKKKISKATKEAMVTPEVRAKFEAGMKSRKSSKGVARPEEVKQKIRIANIGAKRSEEAKMAMANAAKQRPVFSCINCHKQLKAIAKHFTVCGKD